MSADLLKRAEELFRRRQSEICESLEQLDGRGSFVRDEWRREAGAGPGGGGGLTRVLKSGAVFEQAGVNFSSVQGVLGREMTMRLNAGDAPAEFTATGVSLVLHPLSPMVPTVHANFRFLRVGGKSWFGGGMDLTPYYLFEEDARHFHSTIKQSCDRHDPSYYPRFKKWCDEYFYLPHRKECRGVGGLFFDYLGRDEPAELEGIFRFSTDISGAFLDAYVPIAEQRMQVPYSEKEREFQLLRRGRYVEFNLILDRGTHFGLQTGGRTESILMSLPPLVRWEYDAKIDRGTREAELMDAVRNPRDWIG